MEQTGYNHFEFVNVFRFSLSFYDDADIWENATELLIPCSMDINMNSFARWHPSMSSLINGKKIELGNIRMISLNNKQQIRAERK